MITESWEYYTPDPELLPDEDTADRYRSLAIGNAMGELEVTAYNYRTVVLQGECVRCKRPIVAKEDKVRAAKYCTRECYMSARFEKSKWAKAADNCATCGSKLPTRCLKFCNRQCSGVSKRRENKGGTAKTRVTL